MLTLIFETDFMTYEWVATHTLENTGLNQHPIIKSYHYYSLFPQLSFLLVPLLELLVNIILLLDGPEEIITIYFLYSTHITLCL